MVKYSPWHFLMLLLSLSVCMPAFADWTLDNLHSNLNFVSVKKDTVGEVHQFDKLSGSLLASGAFSFTVDLNSVNTQIDIRNQRMIEHLFETKTFAVATVTGQVDPKWLSQLKAGQLSKLDVELTIDLHGVKMKKMANLAIIKLDRKRIFVSSSHPLILNSDDFGLTAGVKMLQTLAGLPNIAQAIPVTVNLLFVK